ncbi:unnamed protein product, partial [Sphagnum compactum]
IWIYFQLIICISVLQNNGIQYHSNILQLLKVSQKVVVTYSFTIDYFSPYFANCSEYLRHKSIVISPSVLIRHSIPVSSAIQMPGEFIITFPRCYHQGFNYGFNCAEAVNFALESWLSKGLDAKSCNCVSDSVKIDV